MPTRKNKLYRHATVYQTGWAMPWVDNSDSKKPKVVYLPRWSTLFSNSQKVCDLCNHDARDDNWEQSLESILEFVQKWITQDGTVFVSYLDNRGERQGQLLKRTSTVDPDVPDVKTRVKLGR